MFVIGSNSGVNGAVVEIARLVKERGHRLIAITSFTQTTDVESRHPSGAKLVDHADVALDNGAPYGDAVLPLPGGGKACAVSSITAALLVQLVVAEAVRRLHRGRRGPPGLPVCQHPRWRTSTTTHLGSTIRRTDPAYCLSPPISQGGRNHGHPQPDTRGGCSCSVPSWSRSPRPAAGPSCPAAPAAAAGDTESGGGETSAENPFGVQADDPLDVVIFKGGYGDEYAKFHEELYKKKFSGAEIKHKAITDIRQQMQPPLQLRQPAGRARQLRRRADAASPRSPTPGS